MDTGVRQNLGDTILHQFFNWSLVIHISKWIRHSKLKKVVDFKTWAIKDFDAVSDSIRFFCLDMDPVSFLHGDMIEREGSK